MDSRCRAVNAAGSPCSAQPVRADGYCYWHSPALEAARAESRRRGGRQRSNQARAKRSLPAGVMTPLEVQGVLALALRDVLAGRIEPGVANAAANLGRALVAVREATTLAEELAELRELVGLEGRTTHEQRATTG